MARVVKKKCVLCGKEYEYCNTCRYDADRPTWLNVFCSENCMNVYYAVSGYVAGEYSVEEAKLKLDACDLSKKSHYNEGTKKILEEIEQKSKKVVVQKQDVKKDK